jgi:elongation factor G
MHPVDSNDISFQIAGAMAFREAFINAQPRLLEPIHDLEILAPEEVTGEIMTDLQGRRGIILGMDVSGHHTRIIAKVPLANLYKYTTALRSVSQGKATFSSRFAEYAAVPPSVQEDVIESHRQLEAEEI